MPKYRGSPAPRTTRSRLVVIVAVAASILLGGGALAWSNLGDGDTGNVATQRADKPRPPYYGPTPSFTPVTPTPWPPTPKPTPTPSPAPPPPTTPPPAPEPEPEPSPEPARDTPDGFPTMETTGPRVSLAAMDTSGSITTDESGQVIEGVSVDSRIKVVNDDVVVRDVRITHNAREAGQYALQIAKKSDGQCPENVVIDHIEIVGDTDVLEDSAKTVYGGCPFTLTNSRIYDVGSAVRITNGAQIVGNYIRANYFIPNSGTHRSGIGLNGGQGNVISGNTIECEGPGCSGAFVMYGDFSQVQDILVENNLFNTTGSYCTYAGSLDSKPHPVAEDVRYIGNHFGRKFSPECGKYGPVAGRDSSGGPGFVWEDNVWADSGQPVA